MAAAASHRLALPAGFMLEEYRIESVLGQGGFGITYLAHDTRLDAQVAIKEMLPKDFATRVAGVAVAPLDTGQERGFAWAKARFIEEARLLARLHHPNVIRIYRFIEQNGTAYLVMEYLQGKTFEKWMKAHRHPTEQELKAILLPILDGLEDVHRHQLLHRDISPENIIITDAGRPILLDFGSARECLRPDQTLSGVIRPGYSPFEQYQSKAPQGPFTDIYALCGVMVRAMTNASPPVAMDRAGPRDPYVPVAKRCQGRYSEPFLRAIDAGFAFLAKDRPQTVAEWRKLFLQTALANRPEPTPAQRHATPPQNPRSQESPRAAAPVKKSLPWFPIMAVVLVTALGVGAWLYFNPPDEPKMEEKKDTKKEEVISGKDDPQHDAPKEDKPKQQALDMTPPKKEQAKPKDHLTNSLGMEFVRVPGVEVMVCVHQTRRRDYAAFMSETGAAMSADDFWTKPSWNGVAVSAGENDPVVQVKWSHAVAFCEWLSRKEKQHYRLPLSTEWRAAAGKAKYPWGDAWPPMDGQRHALVNLADRAAVTAFGQGVEAVPEYADGFATTSPVKSFPPNAWGLYDMGGNVREWCEDAAPSGLGFTCGASWRDGKSEFIASHTPEEWGKEILSPIVGFRCVLEARSEN